MKKWLLLGVLMGLVLGGCGGGSPAASSTSGTSGTSTTTATASDLVLQLSKTSMTDSGSDSVTVTVTAVDSNRNAVSGAAVTVSPDSNAVFTTSSTTTSSTGVVTGTLSIGGDKSNRTIDIIAKSGSITKTATVTVTGASLQATSGSATAGSTSTVQYALVDSNGNAITNAPISVTLNGSTTSAATDANGKYVFSYTVPSTATVSLSASAGGVTTATNVTTASGTTNAATGNVLSASIAANPTNVNVNAAGLTSNQVNVRALFLSASNAPVQYVRVRFDLDGDVNGIGGTLTSGSGYVYTDSSGVAQTSYVPSTRGSGNQQLTIRACWSTTDFAAGSCPNSQLVSVTVVQSGISLTALTNGQIVIDDAKNSYEVSYIVQVVDSAGQPVQGVVVTGSVDLPRYYRGYYALNTAGTSWVLQPGINVCDNEDINRNGVLDTYSNTESEDANHSGSLEPRAADVAISVATPSTSTSTGSNTTDQFGLAYFTLRYGENVASWDDYTVTFSTTVQGSEGRYTTPSANLPVPSIALTTVTSSPAFQVSPYNFTPVNESYAQVTLTTVTDPTTNKSGALCVKQP